MTKIFLSYAEEDHIVGRGLARALVDRGFTVYWWQDPLRPGGRFQDDIEQEIYDANRFVAVLSDSYLRSPWCRRERNMAVQLEVVEERNGFIAVFEAGAVGQEWPGWLAEYARIPVRGTDWNAAVDLYVAAIGQPMHAAAPAMPRSTGPRPKFRNRVDELNLIVDELTIKGGIDVWLISAPPQLGKSWFLDELADRVRRQMPDCQVKMLDVKAERNAIRSDPVMLLKTMLDLPSPLPESVEELRGSDLNRVAMELSRRGLPQLYLLDSADLLEGRSPEWLRRNLDEVFKRLSTARTESRVRVIISGRQVDKWPLMSKVRSRRLRLTEFTEVVVRAALTDLAGPNHNLGTERFDALTRRLHRFCEGLPALLVEMLDRVDDHYFIGIDDDEWWQEAFVEVVRPYVADHLLGTESLFPAGGKDLDQSRKLIELGLKALVPYRMVTRSHLVFHVDRDAELRAALDGLSWGPSSLLKALHETALVVPVPGKPWYEISPPIRRLLYLYYVNDDQDRETVQRVAQQYYLSFSEKVAGTEQPVRLIQYIWHEVVRRSTSVATNLLDDLPEFAAEATQEFICGSIYSASELDQFTSQLLEDDLELQHALSTQVGLFEALCSSIHSAIEVVADD